MTKPTQHPTFDQAVDDILAIQEADLSSHEGRQEMIDALQRLIDTGAAWHLDGWVGRMAMDAINQGECCLGPEGFLDAYGNYVPSRFEIKPGAPGSIEFTRR